MKYVTLIIITTALFTSGCIPYLAGVIATSRSNSQGRQNCADMGESGLMVLRGDGRLENV